VSIVEYPAGRTSLAIPSGKISGNLDVPTTLLIRSADFDIVFTSDVSEQGSGFIISYQVSICFCLLNNLKVISFVYRGATPVAGPVALRCWTQIC
jgi:hypothetical protein